MKLVTSELIPVYETGKGERVVDGRELHEFLEVGKDFTTWIKERIAKFGFVENEDFSLTLTKIGERQNVTRHDYILKLDMAKELAMVESNEKGSQVRKYFIEVEKRFAGHKIDVNKPLALEDLIIMQAQSVKELKNKVSLLESTVTESNATIHTIQDTFLKRDEDWRKQMNSMLNGAAYRTGGQYRDLRSDSYKVLEDRANCDLDRRLRNLKERLQDSGATKTKVSETTRMDVIEADSKLKEIYSTIVKEISIGSLKIAR